MGCSLFKTSGCLLLRAAAERGVLIACKLVSLKLRGPSRGGCPTNIPLASQILPYKFSSSFQFIHNLDFCDFR